jgi:hypothetical protein
MIPNDVERLQAAADKAQRDLLTAQADAAALAKAKATPRAPDVVITDLLALIVMRLGNRKDLQLLLAELRATTEPEPEPLA